MSSKEPESTPSVIRQKVSRLVTLPASALACRSFLDILDNIILMGLGSLNLLAFCFASFSAACVLTLGFVLGCTRLRKLYENNVVLLSLGALAVLSSGFLIVNQDLCWLQGVLLTWGQLSTLTFSGIIAHCINTWVIFEEKLSFRYLFVLGYGLTLVTALFLCSILGVSMQGLYCLPADPLSVYVSWFPLLLSFYFSWTSSLKVSEYLSSLKAEDFGGKKDQKTDSARHMKYSYCLQAGHFLFTPYPFSPGSITLSIISLTSLPLLGYYFLLCFLFLTFSKRQAKVAQSLTSSLNQ